MIRMGEATGRLLSIFVGMTMFLVLINYTIGVPIATKTYGVIMGYAVFSLAVITLGILFPTRPSVFLGRFLQICWGLTFVAGVFALIGLLFCGIDKIAISPLWFQRLSLFITMGAIGGLIFRKIGKACHEIQDFVQYIVVEEAV